MLFFNMILVLPFIYDNTARASSTYYVSTSGHEPPTGDGSIGNPWRYIDASVDRLSAGDTLIVRGGTYSEVVTVTVSGTSGSWITIQNYTGETVIIDKARSNGAGYDDGIVEINARYILFDGFTVSNSSNNCIAINGNNVHNVTVQNCHTKYSLYCGIRPSNQYYTPNLRNIIIDNNWIQYTRNYGGSSGGSQEAMSVLMCSYIQITNNTIDSTSKYLGIDIKHYNDNVTIAYNNVYTNGDYSGASCVNIYLDAQGEDIDNVDIYNNYIHGGGTAISLGSEDLYGSVTNIDIYNNIIIGGSTSSYLPHGITTNNPISPYTMTVENINIYNNLIYLQVASSSYYGIRMNTHTGGIWENVVIKNNIFRGQGKGIYRGSEQPSGEIDADYNFYYTGTSTDMSGVNDMSGDPLWVSSSDYHLQSSSPCINNGTSSGSPPGFDYDDNTRPSSVYYDMGPYEYTGGITLGPPTSFGLAPELDNVLTTSIKLHWTKGTGADHTVIQRKTTGYPTSHSDGTNIYNESAGEFQDTGLTPGQKYWYRAWSYLSGNYSVDNASFSEFTYPNPPSGSSMNLSYTPSLSVNLSWSKGTGANNTVVLMKTGGMPSSITDGTIVYNSTGTYTIVNIANGSSVYFKAWSYTEWDTSYRFSFTGLSFYSSTDEGMYINCYDEETEANLTFDIFIVNSSGTEFFIDTGCINTFVVNTSMLPTGENCQIMVTATGYKTRVFYIDIDVGIAVFLNVYLPSNTSDVALYYLKVVETVEREYGSIDVPVEDASVDVQRYIVGEGSYVSMSIMKTDSNGYVNLYLLYGELNSYRVEISKSGYDDSTSFYIPQPPNEWGQTTEKVFRLVLTGSTPVVPTVYSFWDTIVFTATMNSNETILVVFSDSLSLVVNAQVYIYEYYDAEMTLVDTANYTSDSFSYYVSGVNTSRLHYCDLFLNSSGFYGDGFNIQPLRIVIFNLVYSIVREKFDLEARIQAIVGPGPIGEGSWCPFIILLISLCVLASFGPFHVGFAVMFSGFTMGLLSVVFSIWLTNVFPVSPTAVIGLIIGIGVLYLLAKRPGDML